MRYRSKWSEDAILKEAEKYGCKREFEIGNAAAYKAALQRGLINTLFDNLRSTWSMEAVLREGAKYQSRTKFYHGNRGAYAAALRLGVIDKIHPMSFERTDNDTIYIWRVVDQYFNGDPVYKIGVTSARLGTERVERVARDAGFEYVLICCEPVTCRATELEKRLHLLGHDPRFVGFGGATEFRAMSDAVLWVALGLISEVTVRKT